MPLSPLHCAQVPFFRTIRSCALLPTHLGLCLWRAGWRRCATGQLPECKEGHGIHVSSPETWEEGSAWRMVSNLQTISLILPVYIYLKVSRIVAAFNVQPPVYLVHEQDRTIVFPSENCGKFSALIGWSTCEVQGNSSQTQGFSHSPMPYGTYHTLPSYESISQPPSMPVHAVQQLNCLLCTYVIYHLTMIHATKPQRRVIRKTIQVASLA